MDASKNTLVATLLCKCPSCKQGRLFVQNKVFPLSGYLEMNKECSHCGQKLLGESNNGPGINFALTTILFFLNVVWYYPIFGINAFDNSIYYFLLSSLLVVIIAQPYLMRLSRSLYLYLLFAFKS